MVAGNAVQAATLFGRVVWFITFISSGVVAAIGYQLKPGRGLAQMQWVFIACAIVLAVSQLLVFITRIPGRASKIGWGVVRAGSLIYLVVLTILCWVSQSHILSSLFSATRLEEYNIARQAPPSAANDAEVETFADIHDAQAVLKWGKILMIVVAALHGFAVLMFVLTATMLAAAKRRDDYYASDEGAAERLGRLKADVEMSGAAAAKKAEARDYDAVKTRMEKRYGKAATDAHWMERGEGSPKAKAASPPKAKKMTKKEKALAAQQAKELEAGNRAAGSKFAKAFSDDGDGDY